jgi:hypothetical protein
MKSLVNIVFTIGLIAPGLSHAVEPLTHAQVRSELIQLEDAGYNPADVGNYPRGVKHAQTLVAQQNEANTAYGSDTAGVSQSGSMARSGEK